MIHRQSFLGKFAAAVMAKSGTYLLLPPRTLAQLLRFSPLTTNMFGVGWNVIIVQKAHGRHSITAYVKSGSKVGNWRLSGVSFKKFTALFSEFCYKQAK